MKSFLLTCMVTAALCLVWAGQILKAAKEAWDKRDK